MSSDFPIMLEIANTIDFEKYRSGLRQFGHNLLEETKAEAERAGLVVSTELRDLKGDRVADAIVNEARAAGCDLMSHRHAWAARL